MAMYVCVLSIKCIFVNFAVDFILVQCLQLLTHLEVEKLIKKLKIIDVINISPMSTIL